MSHDERRRTHTVYADPKRPDAAPPEPHVGWEDIEAASAPSVAPRAEPPQRLQGELDRNRVRTIPTANDTAPPHVRPPRAWRTLDPQEQQTAADLIEHLARHHELLACAEGLPRRPRVAVLLRAAADELRDRNR